MEILKCATWYIIVDPYYLLFIINSSVLSLQYIISIDRSLLNKISWNFYSYALLKS